MRYNLPAGAKFDGEDAAGNPRFRIEIPLDEHGFFGRECPACDRTFLVSRESYDPLPDDLRLWCVYCGHNDDHTEFMTGQQKARVMSIAGDVGKQIVSDSLDLAFRNMARRSQRNSFVRLTYKRARVHPRPLPGITEEELVRERSCASCGMRYAVFGEHRFCPVCGLLPAATTSVDALAAETHRLDALDHLPVEARASLREQGVLDRQYVDTIENLVGVVESLARSIFAGRVQGSAAVLKGKGNVFQRLDDLADLFALHLQADLRHPLGSRWSDLQRTWAARHVYVHNDGLVDDRYLRAVPSTNLKVGQRLPVTEADARVGIERVLALVDLMAQV